MALSWGAKCGGEQRVTGEKLRVLFFFGGKNQTGSSDADCGAP